MTENTESHNLCLRLHLSQHALVVVSSCKELGHLDGSCVTRSPDPQVTRLLHSSDWQLWGHKPERLAFVQ